MRRELIEQPCGAGTVYRNDGDFVGQVGYELRVYQNYSDARTKDSAAAPLGRKPVEGRVTGLDNNTLWSDGALLTLHLRDGRRLDFQIWLDGMITTNSDLYEVT